MTVYLPRSETGLPPRPSTGTALTVAGVGTNGFAVHWPAEPGPIGYDAAHIRALLLAYWKYHTDPPPAGHGWADIAYQDAVDQAGRVWDLRGVDRRSAANGDTTVNTQWGALLLMVGAGEEPSQAMVTAVRDWRRTRWLARFPTAVHVVGHKDVRLDPTECPGPSVYAMVTGGTFEQGEPMTVFVLDASHYQAGLPIASLRAQGYVGVILKAGQHTFTPDTAFAGHLAQARTAGLLSAAYWFLHDTNIAGQAALTRSVVPPDVPVWIDVEHYTYSDGTVSNPTRDDAYAYADALRARGGEVGGIYHGAQPKPGYGGWWRPAYLTDPTGTASVTYASQGGDNGTPWSAGQTRHPDLWQFCRYGRIAGYSGDLDLNAYRGTAAQLAATGWFWTPPTDGSSDMPLNAADIDLIWAMLTSRQFTAATEADEDLRSRSLAGLLLVAARSGEAIRSGIGPISNRTTEAAGQLTGIADVVAGLAGRPDPSAVDVGELATQLLTYLPTDLVSQLLDALGDRIKKA